MFPTINKKETGVKVYLLFVICYQFLFNVNNIRKHDFLTVAL